MNTTGVAMGNTGSDDGLSIGPPRGPEHIGTLTLRRYRAGELDGETHAAVTRRLADDAGLRARLEALAAEQKNFEAAIPFDRFAGGVERARREPGRVVGTRVSRRGWMVIGTSLLSAAAGLALFAGGVTDNHGGNRIKGEAAKIVVRIAPATGGAQREAAVVEVLAAGDRLRIGYACNAEAAEASGENCAPVRHLVALSIDEAGGLSPVYPDRPEATESLPITPGGLVDYLPGGFEFFGSGLERLFVFVGNEPFAIEDAKKAVRTAFAADKGDLRGAALAGSNPVAGSLEVTTFLFEKP